MRYPGDAQLLAENAALREQIQTLTGIIGSLKEQIEELAQHNHVLRLKIDAMARKLFGKSSEKLDPAQLQMVFDALQKETAGEDAARKAGASDSPACGSVWISVPLTKWLTDSGVTRIVTRLKRSRFSGGSG